MALPAPQIRPQVTALHNSSLHTESLPQKPRLPQTICSSSLAHTAAPLSPYRSPELLQNHVQLFWIKVQKELHQLEYLDLSHGWVRGREFSHRVCSLPLLAALLTVHWYHLSISLHMGMKATDRSRRACCRLWSERKTDPLCLLFVYHTVWGYRVWPCFQGHMPIPVPRAQECCPRGFYSLSHKPTDSRKP